MLPGERVRLHTAYARALSAEPGSGRGRGGRGRTRLSLLRRARSARALEASLEAAPPRGRRTRRPRRNGTSSAYSSSGHGSGTPSACRRGRSRRGPAARLGAAAPWATWNARSRCSTRRWRSWAPRRTRSGARSCSSRARSALRSLGHGEDAAPALETALAALPADVPSRARALILTQLAGVRLYAFGLGEASRTGEAAVAAARVARSRELGGGRGDHTRHRPDLLGDTEPGLERLRAGLAIALDAGDNTTALRGYVNLSDALRCRAATNTPPRSRGKAWRSPRAWVRPTASARICAATWSSRCCASDAG